MEILIIGHVCIDHNSSENTSYIGAGGSLMFMHKVYKAFPDCEVTMVAPYGDDFFPFLGDAKMLPMKPVHQSTLIYENISKNGKRVQKARQRQSAEFFPLAQDVIEKIQTADIIFFAPLAPTIPTDYFITVAKHAKPSAYKVLLPQGYYRNFAADDSVFEREFLEAPEVLKYLDLVVVSEQDHAQMLAEAQKWTSAHPVTCVITKGEKGALVLKQKESWLIPTEEVKESDIVDSVGSGDIFSAAFAYQFVKTRDLQKAGQFANEVARQCLFYSAENLQIDFSKLL